MQTLYIDVYFLINFSIDLLSLYFAARIAKLSTTVMRILIAAGVGAAIAIANIFVSMVWIGYLGLFLGFVIMIIIAAGRVSLYRKIKYAFCFSVVEMLVGGFVYFMYEFLDERLVDLIDAETGGGENRSLLLFALIVLMSIGVFKCLISVFTFSSGTSYVKVRVEMLGRNFTGEALVDSGNTASDPLDNRSVMLLSVDAAEKLLGTSATEMKETSSLPCELKKRVRFIPVSFGGVKKVLVGFRPDSVRVLTDGKEETIDVTLAIDTEGGKYGGTNMLVAAAAIRDVNR